VVAAVLLVVCGQASATTLSSNPQGDTAVAFQFPRQGPYAPVFAALRPAGGVFGRPTRLTRQGAWGADVAVAPGGAAVAAWHDTGDDAIRASFRESGGNWGAPVTLAEDGRAAQAAIDSNGAALVVWERPSGGMRSAARPSGGPFLAPRNLPGAGSLQALAMDAAGNAIVLSLLDGSKPLVQSSFLPVGGRFGAAKPLATSGRSYGVGLAMNAAGDAIAVFSTEDGARRRAGPPGATSGRRPP
jgi:hypothetical protein